MTGGSAPGTAPTSVASGDRRFIGVYTMQIDQERGRGERRREAVGPSRQQSEADGREGNAEHPRVVGGTRPSGTGRDRVRRISASVSRS